MIMTTKRKKLLLEKRNRLKPIDETQLKSLHILQGGSPDGENEKPPIDMLSPSRPVLPPVVDPMHMPKVKAPFEMPSIDHTKQRLRLHNIIENTNQALGDLSATMGSGKGLFAKVPKTMSFIGGMPAFEKGYPDNTPFSPSQSMNDGLNGMIEETKAALKSKSITTRKKVLSSKTQRGVGDT